jgi:CBS domain-containing protein
LRPSTANKPGGEHKSDAVFDSIMFSSYHKVPGHLQMEITPLVPFCMKLMRVGHTTNVTSDKEEKKMAKVENRTLREIMTKDVATVTLKDNVYEVACKMRDWNVGVIPVVDEKQDVIGIITDRDIVIRGLAEKREGSAAVEEVMTRDIILGQPDMTVDEAAKIMAQHQIRRLPVVENGKLVGIVALGDMAVRQAHHDEASEALYEISEPAPRH